MRRKGGGGDAKMAAEGKGRERKGAGRGGKKHSELRLPADAYSS